jgi:ElaB/YqjD/DUF883 family membrane-anchored ribosome-binding protein
MEDEMSNDTMLLRELKSLREEMSSSQKARSSCAVDHASPGGDAAESPTQPIEAIEERRLDGELRELVDAIKEFVQDAEKNASAHPAATAVGGMVVGILIGRLLGRR